MSHPGEGMQLAPYSGQEAVREGGGRRSPGSLTVGKALNVPLGPVNFPKTFESEPASTTACH